MGQQRPKKIGGEQDPLNFCTAAYFPCQRFVKETALSAPLLPRNITSGHFVSHCLHPVFALSRSLCLHFVSLCLHFVSLCFHCVQVSLFQHFITPLSASASPKISLRDPLEGFKAEMGELYPSTCHWTSTSAGCG